MTATPNLERVLILATHPDDDVIGAGGLIQRTIAGGGTLRVLFVTSGENNEWPQRAMWRKWRITREDQKEWARIRQREAESALGTIGAPPQCSFFLGYPDQQVSTLARSGDRRLIDDLVRHSSEFRPTLVISPSFFDVHPDHRATAYFAHEAPGAEAPIATYLVHGRRPESREQFTLHLTPEERARKRDAIACHESQLLLSRRRFLGEAQPTETFYAPEHDLVRIDSIAQERLRGFRHSVQAVIGALRR